MLELVAITDWLDYKINTRPRTRTGVKGEPLAEAGSKAGDKTTSNPATGQKQSNGCLCPAPRRGFTFGDFAVPVSVERLFEASTLPNILIGVTVPSAERPCGASTLRFRCRRADAGGDPPIGFGGTPRWGFRPTISVPQGGCRRRSANQVRDSSADTSSSSS